MLEVKHLTRRFGDFTAVDDVSFQIDSGEIVGLLGHNGAGKTTIMRMIAGYLEPNQGSITVDGCDLTTEPQRVKAGLGYLPENLPIYGELSVADYLDYTADIKGLVGEHKMAAVKQSVAATDIADRLAAPIATLSRGYKQRVGVAQALLGDPKLLILDEPTNGLDPEQTQHMRALIRDISQRATVILSTHIMQEVDAICSRVLMLNGGCLAVDEQLASLLETNHLLIETALPPVDSALLRALPGVASLRSLDSAPEGVYQYRAELAAETNQQALAASLAEAVVNAGHALYRLQPELRDLETLFREIADSNFQRGGLNDAA
jgi:ABC-2 type transport system ATP-binding protein